MTKYGAKLKDLLDRWFKTKESLSKEDYKMLKDLCYEVLR